jgi:hypothetical protein
MAKALDTVYGPVSLSEMLLAKPVLASTWKKIASGNHGRLARFGQVTPLYEGEAWVRDSALYGSNPTEGDAMDLNAFRRQLRAHRPVETDHTLVILWAQIYAEDCDMEIDIVRHELDDGGVIAPATLTTLNPVAPAGGPSWAEDTQAILLSNALSATTQIPHLCGTLMRAKSVDGLDPATLYNAHLREYWIPVGDLPI